jgi:hypothetical protein
VSRAAVDGTADSDARLEWVLQDPLRYAGTFALIVPGNGTVSRRKPRTPFFAVDPASPGLAAALAPAAAALNAAAGALEKALGRRLFAWRVETAGLPSCAAGSGPCAVWEASSGRLVLDAALAGKIAAAGGGGEPETALPSGRAAAGVRGIQAVGSARVTVKAMAAGDKGAAAGSKPAPAEEDGSGTGVVDDGGLGALLAASVERLMEQAAGAAALLEAGRVRPVTAGCWPEDHALHALEHPVPAVVAAFCKPRSDRKACVCVCLLLVQRSVHDLAGVFQRAAPAALALLMAAQVPLWWCIACPLVLGERRR